MGFTPRAPYNRFRILEFLLDKFKSGKETREVDLANLLNLSEHSIRLHLDSLRDIGIIKWSSLGTEQPGGIIYRWYDSKSPHEVPVLTRYTNLTKEVAAYLHKRRDSTNVEITGHLEKIGNYKQWKRGGLLKTISNILVSLKKTGFAEAIYQGGTTFSHVYLVKERADFVEELTMKLRDAVSGGAELKAMEHLYCSYIDDHNALKNDSTAGVGFYVSVSSALNRSSAEEVQRRIFDYISEKGPSRPSDMNRHLMHDVKDQLAKMIASGMVIKRHQGRKVLYSINPDYKPT